MPGKKALLVISTAAAVLGLGGCGSSSTPAAAPIPTTTAAPAVATVTTAPVVATTTTSPTNQATVPTPVQPSAPVTPAAFDLNTLNTAVLPTPALLPMNDVYQWGYPGGLHNATAKPDANGGVLWDSACLDYPTVFANGWKGSQETTLFSPNKNFIPSSHEPGFEVPWTATATVLAFVDAKSATATATEIGKANDGCLSRLSGFRHLSDVSVQRVTATADGQSWSVTAGGGSNPMEVHYYMVQRGSFIITVSVSRSTAWNGPVPAYTGAADGSTDKALLTDMATHLCGYTGACS